MTESKLKLLISESGKEDIDNERGAKVFSEKG